MNDHANTVRETIMPLTDSEAIRLQEAAGDVSEMLRLLPKARISLACNFPKGKKVTYSWRPDLWTAPHD